MLPVLQRNSSQNLILTFKKKKNCFYTLISFKGILTTPDVIQFAYPDLSSPSTGLSAGTQWVHSTASVLNRSDAFSSFFSLLTNH